MIAGAIIVDGRHPLVPSVACLGDKSVSEAHGICITEDDLQPMPQSIEPRRASGVRLRQDQCGGVWAQGEACRSWTGLKLPNMSTSPPVIGIIMGSRSDWETMQHAAATLEALAVPHEVRVVSAHRTPDLLFSYAEAAAGRGLRAIIAGAGGAAHLPGMCAAKTWLPVLGVPVESKALHGMDSLLSIVQMPAGIPVPTFAIGRAGAVNAALTAAAMLAVGDAEVRARLLAWRAAQTAKVLADADPRASGPA